MNKELSNYFKGDDLAASTWKNKYAIVGEETPDDMHKRLAKAFAIKELEYAKQKGNLSMEDFNALSQEGKIYAAFATHYARLKPEAALDAITTRVYNLFKDFKYVIPGGSIMATLGTDTLSSLSNCFVVDSPIDSISGVMEQLNKQAQLTKYRGGVGFDISTLRPSGATVKNSAKTSTGAASFMDLFSHVNNTVAQNGRRGALMLSMHINHPDSEEFITKKQDLSKVTGANISVKISDAFMKAVENDEDYILRWPCDREYSYSATVINSLEYNKLYPVLDGKQYIKKIKARELWETLNKCAHNTAEPGILFIDRIHQYSPDGVYPKFQTISTNPCAEIPMGPYDSCRLMHLNLTSFVKGAYGRDPYIDRDLVYTTTYEAMRLSDTLVDLELQALNKILEKIRQDEHSAAIELWENIQKTAFEARRTGLGFTGLADTLAMLNLAYDSEEALSIVDELLHVIMEAQLDCTIDLAIIRGTFPAYDATLEYTPEGEGQNKFFNFLKTSFPVQYHKMVTLGKGRRNISFSTVAPTGTVSLMTQTSSGIEPIFAPYYSRRRKCSFATDRVDFVDNVGEKYTEFYVLHPTFKSWICSTKQWNEGTSDTQAYINALTKSELDNLFKESPWYKSTASDINWEKRLELQSIVQQYTTHAISSTLNLPAKTTQKEVEHIYQRAWELGLKGVTIYRDGSREGILNTTTTPGFIHLLEEGRQAPRRPKVLEADYYQIKSKGIQYIVLVGLLDGKPYEIFTFQPTKPVDIKAHKGTITKVKSGCYTYDSQFIQIANLYLSTENIEENACTLYTSMLLRHNVDIQFIIKTAKKVNENISSFSSAMCRVLSKYIEVKEVKGESCPQCGGRLIREAGCIKCLDCDYSKCL